MVIKSTDLYPVIFNGKYSYLFLNSEDTQKVLKCYAIKNILFFIICTLW